MKLSIFTPALLALIALPAFAEEQAITQITDLTPGSMAAVQGTVERITDEDEFRLADATGMVEVDIGSNWVPVDIGETVIVRGFVDDDDGPREIYARSLTRADGTVITFERRDD